MARKVAFGDREVKIGDLEAILLKETGEFFKRVGSLVGPWVAGYSPHPWERERERESVPPHSPLDHKRVARDQGVPRKTLQVRGRNCR